MSSAPAESVVWSDDRKILAAKIREALPDDIRIQAADGDVWANRAFLSVTSDYFSAMLDEQKFREGQEGTGDLRQYSKDVVTRVINYFYTGQISCQVNFNH